MTHFVLQRLASLVLVVLAMSLLMFVIAHALPGDPARVAAGGADATVEMIAHARRDLGLDRPVLSQYGIYLGKVLRGDLGRSIVTQRRIWDDLVERMPATAELALTAVAFSCAVGIPLGVLAATRRDHVADHLSRAISLLGISMPVFWSGLVGILVFYVILGWLPVGGRLSYELTPPDSVTGFYTIDSLVVGDVRRFCNALWHLALPALILSSTSVALITRMTRSCVLDVLREDYVRTARAKGVAERYVLAKHALSNASVPIVTAVGLQMGTLMGGAVLTETIFTWPGVGTYAVTAVENQDYPAIMGFAMMFSMLYALINVVVDISCFLLHPQMTLKA